MIVTCICEHDYQDHKYGKGRRIGNATQQQHKNVVAKCTVCGLLRFTNKPNRGTVKKASGRGKNGYWIETAEHHRERFRKTKGHG